MRADVVTGLSHVKYEELDQQLPNDRLNIGNIVESQIVSNRNIKNVTTLLLKTIIDSLKSN